MESRLENGARTQVLLPLSGDAVRLIGRDAEQEIATRLMAKSRLLTLVGISSVGKSALARRIASGKARAFRDGVRYLDMSGAIRARAAGLGKDRTKSNLLSEEFTQHVLTETSDQEMLLLIDNCDWNIDASAELVLTLLQCSPFLRILATSKQPLRLNGECVLQIQPLRCSAQLVGEAQSDVDMADAIQIFTEHAASAQLGLPAHSIDGETVAQICRKLCGVPGAISRAASLVARHAGRARSAGPRSVAIEPKEAGDLVDSILFGIAEASCASCDESEKALLARLAVFDDSSALDQIKAACVDRVVAASKVAYLLDGLIEKSLVVRTEHAGESRFSVCEPIRPYWRKRTDSLDAGAVLARFTAWLREHTERAYEEFLTSEQEAWTTRFTLGWNDTRRVLVRNLAHCQSSLQAAETVVRLWPYAAAINRNEAAELLQLARSRNANDERVLPSLMACLAQVALEQTDMRTLASPIEVYLLPGAPGADADAPGQDALIRGALAVLREQWGEAVPLYRKAFEAFDVSGEPVSAWHASNHLAVALAHAGELKAARATAADCLAGTPTEGASWSRSLALWSAAFVAWKTRKVDKARAHAQEALELKVEFDDPVGKARCLEMLGWVAVSSRKYEHGAKLLGAASVVWPGVQQLPELRAEHDAAVDQARSVMGLDSFRRSFRKGSELGASVITSLVHETDRGDAKLVATAGPSALTPRELEVAALVAKGLTNRRVAARLAIAQRTVEAHVESILLKLNLRSRAQIAAWLVKSGGSTE